MPSVVNPSTPSTTYGANNPMFTSYPSSLGGLTPGSADIGGWMQRDVSPFVDSLSPRARPVLDMIKKKDTSDDDVYEWGTSVDLSKVSRVATATVLTSDLTFAVTTGDGVLFQKYQVIAVYNLDANGRAKWSTREIMWVTGISGDTLTVVRARGNTTAVQFTGGAAGVGARIEILNTALPEGADFSTGPTTFGTFYKNYWQLIEKGHKVSIEGNATKDQEHQKGNNIARLMTKAAEDNLMEFERSIIQGTADRGSATSNLPSQMGGIFEFIPSANVTDMSGARITPYDIEAQGAALWESVADNAANKLLMSMTTSRMFDGMLNPYRNGQMDTTAVNLTFKSFETRFGVFQIIPTRWIPDGVVAGVDFSRLTLMTYQGMDWTEKEHPTNGAYIWRSIFGRKGLKVEAPEVMFLLHNFDTNFQNYGRSL